MSNCAKYVGRSSTGSNSDQRIRFCYAEPFSIGFSGLHAILKVLYCLGQSNGSSGNAADHHIRREIEGRRTFRGIERTQATRGARSKIEEPAATAHPRSYLFNSSG